MTDFESLIQKVDYYIL
ncbi:Hypothetical protein LLA12_00823 [Lactococcus lactis subsp. lactis]|nr:Hypothetical protein LLA12_00823 [Lactococcus lactis subsp. lactis]